MSPACSRLTAWAVLAGLAGCDTLLGNAPPVAVAAASHSGGAAPLDVTFRAQGTHDPDGRVVSLVWSFSDGTSASALTVTKTLTAAGPFTAVLTATDDGGASDTASVVVAVGDACPAPFTMGEDELLPLAVGRTWRYDALTYRGYGSSSGSSEDEGVLTLTVESDLGCAGGFRRFAVASRYEGRASATGPDGIKRDRGPVSRSQGFTWTVGDSLRLGGLLAEPILWRRTTPAPVEVAASERARVSRTVVFRRGVGIARRSSGEFISTGSGSNGDRWTIIP